MQELMLGALLVLTVAWLVVRIRQNKAAVIAESKPAAKDSGTFHAVAIKCSDNACDAAKAMTGRRFLSGAAPRLPLPECDFLECSCQILLTRIKTKEHAHGACQLVLVNESVAILVKLIERLLDVTKKSSHCLNAKSCQVIAISHQDIQNADSKPRRCFFSCVVLASITKADLRLATVNLANVTIGMAVCCCRNVVVRINISIGANGTTR